MLLSTDKQILQWLDEAFQNFQPHEQYLKRNQGFPLPRYCKLTSIIEGEDKLRIPLLDFDVKLQCETILIEAKKEEGRNRGLFATVKGMGGGKTRSLYELNYYFLNNTDPSVFPMTITFNSRWGFRGNDSSSVKRINDVYILEIVVRMLSVFYGESYSRVRDLVYPLKTIATEAATHVLSAVVLHMITKLEEKTHTQISTFILMLDEIVKLHTRLKLITYDEVDSFMRSIREILLDTSIRPNLSQGLVVSSLSLSPVGKTSSSRSITPINSPMELNSSQIVDEVWKPRMETFFDHHNVSRNTRADLYRRLEIIASSMNSIPRIVEDATTAIEEQLQVQSPPAGFRSIYEWFHQFVHSVIDKMKRTLAVKYLPTTISLNHLYPVVFDKLIGLANPHIPVMELIEHSAYTNTIKSFPLLEADAKKVTIIPTASFAWLTKDDTGCLQDAEANGILRNMASIMKTVTVKGQKEGKLLEEFVHDFLMLRLLVLSSTSMPVRESICDRPFCIYDLLSIPREKFRFLPGAIKSKLNKRIGEVDYDEGIEPHTMENKLCYNGNGSIPDAWLDEIQSVLSGRNRFYVIKGHPDDAFDCLLVYYPEGEDPYFYFIETKSKDLSIGTKAREGEEKVSHQYKIVNDTIGRLFPVSTNLVNERNSPSAPYTAVRRALQNRQFLYIYLTTHPQPFSHKEDFCVVLGDCETKRFLSFAYDVYRAARTTNSKEGIDRVDGRFEWL